MTQKNIFATTITFQGVMILLLASCFYLYEFIIQVAPGAIAQNLMHDFAIDATKLGLISSFFYYSYTPLQLTSGLLLDRYSARIILACVTATFAFGALLFAYAPNVYIAVMARFIMGGASSCAFIGVLHLAIRWVPPAYFAFFAGIVSLMGAMGGGLGSAPLAILLKYFDWRTTLAGFAYVGFVLAFLIAILVRNQPAHSKIITTPITKQNFIWNNLKIVLRNRQTLPIGIYSFLIWAPVLGFTALWGATFLRLSCNLDIIAATHAIGYMWLGLALFSPLIGWLSDFIGRRCIILTVCGLVGAIIMSWVIFVTNISLVKLNILMFILGFASSGQTIAFASVKDNNSPFTNSTANGFNNMCVVAGGSLFPTLIGKILDIYWQGTIENGIRIYELSTYQIALTTLPLCYFTAAIISALFIKETHCRATWQEQTDK